VACPLDLGALVQSDGPPTCSKCGVSFEYIEVTRGACVLDLRALDHPREVSITFALPAAAPAQDVLVRTAPGPGAGQELPGREEIRRRFGTKLQRASMHHIANVAREQGGELPVLDLGCGGGGNRQALMLLGLSRVTAVDLWSPAADYLADVHRLPFPDASFGLVVATATVEHFTNPFLAFREISRVLRPGGVLVATASFWESWHRSYFHPSPGGLIVLCRDAELELSDLWSGWGFIASVGAHALGLARHKPALYRAQAAFDSAFRRLRGEAAVSEHRLRTSGSFGLRAFKPGPRPL
jgi:SAM-dependent methyltransferase